MNNYQIKSFFQWDLSVAVITILYNALFVSCLINAMVNSLVLFELFALCCIAVPLVLAPLRLIVSEKSLKVRRLVGTFSIDISDIKSIRIINEDEFFFDRLTRTCGSGGLYGFFGRFRHDKYGKIRMFVTRKEQCFLIKLKNGKVVAISSPKRESIVEVINKTIKV